MSKHADGSGLAGRTAVVTGANGGLGAGIVRHLTERGAKVIRVDLAGAGPDSVDHALDVRDREQVDATFAEINSEFGLDILVNSHGVLQQLLEVAHTPDDELERVMTTNFTGTFHTCRAAARAMQARRWGRIINVASQAGRAPWPGTAVYGASKGAVISLTQSLATELGPHGITANAVCPGVMLTSMTESAFAAASSESQDLADLLAQKTSSLPVRRLGTADDVGAMVAYLASPEAGFVTGTTMNITGGEQFF